MPDIKIVVNIKGDRAAVGVQAPDTDPVVEVVPIVHQEDALQEAFVAATNLVERAQERWSASPKDPAYQRPPPPPATPTVRGPRQVGTPAPVRPAGPTMERPRMF